jgi:hypothetical protein
MINQILISVIQNIIQNLIGQLDFILFIIILLTSILIYKKSITYYKLSLYQGFKHFANSFLFIGLSAITTFSQNILSKYLKNSQPTHETTILNIFEGLTFLNFYFLAMGVFFLIYSLVWKEIKLKNFNILILNLLAFILSYISYQKEYLFYILVIILLIYGIMISYEKYTSSKNKQSQLYLISLILITITFVIQLLLGFFEIIKIYANISTIGVFLILIYITTKKYK